MTPLQNELTECVLELSKKVKILEAHMVLIQDTERQFRVIPESKTITTVKTLKIIRNKAKIIEKEIKILSRKIRVLKRKIARGQT